MRSVLKVKRNGKIKELDGERVQAPGGTAVDWNLDVRIEMIQALIPLALDEVNDMLQEDLEYLTGKKYSRDGGRSGLYRWGEQRGSVYLGDQKVAVKVPRVRDAVARKAVRLPSYEGLQNPRRANDLALAKVLKGLSCRDYKSCVEAVPETFGLSASTVSRRFKRASMKKLQELAERDLSGYDLAAIFLDGKTFGDDEMLIALGVTMTGQKVLLGFVQTATENEKVCTEFLRNLVERGLKFTQGILAVIDGAKGLRKAVVNVFSDRAAVQRCQWHKRENVLEYLPKEKRGTYRRKLQSAYEQPTYAKAKSALMKVRSELALLNQSAVNSLDEGLEETLTLHRLGLVRELGRSFKTTNCIENLQSLVEQRTGKVDSWRNSEQKQRWLATTLLDIEPRLNKVQGFHHLKRLRAMIEMSQKEGLEKVA
jgi:transposase-like protein